MHHLKRYFLVYTLIPFTVISLAASYYRFMITYDYEVIHEGICDPYQEQCSLYCENDKCDEPFYFKTIHRRADTLRNICGDILVSECANAQSCQPNEQSCFVTYCTPGSEEICEDLEMPDMPYQETDFEIKALEDISINNTDS